MLFHYIQYEQKIVRHADHVNVSWEEPFELFRCSIVNPETYATQLSPCDLEDPPFSLFPNFSSRTLPIRSLHEQRGRATQLN